MNDPIQHRSDIDDKQPESSKRRAKGKSRALSPESKCRQERREREHLRAVFKTWFDGFSDELKTYTQVPAGQPLHIPFEIREWPSELYREREKADRRLNDSTGVLASIRQLFRVFELNLADIRDPFRHFLVLLRMVQDELNGVPGVDIVILQKKNQEIVTEMIRVSLGRNRIVWVLLYEDIGQCDICYEEMLKGSNAVTMPCPLKHTFCMDDAINHFVRYPLVEVDQRCPKCFFPLPANDEWVPRRFRPLLG